LSQSGVNLYIKTIDSEVNEIKNE